MSISAYAPAMSAIDPNTGQLIELPIDQSGAYIMQDGSTVLTTAQLPSTVQGGKSLLKPELAQHLSQHPGYKASVGRGGFTLGATDPRWMNMSAPRTGRGMVSRKPTALTMGHAASTLGVPQTSALAPAASGLLSLGTRYTPSSASAFGANASVSGTAAIVPSTGTASGILSTNPNIGIERDPSYRLAAAIAGSGSRGRPRGRRPLRGQFPVVPIDMVRQLGIEQQVILQPAAPVAMRNKAVLCRPLSMCRKIQATPTQYDSVSQDASTFMRTDEVDEAYVRKQSRKRDTQGLKAEVACQFTEESTQSDSVGEKAEKRRKTLDTGTSPSLIASVNAASQTGEAEAEETLQRTCYVPIPIPVPILVPVPVCFFSHSIPVFMPLPLPCILPFPIPKSRPESAMVHESTSSVQSNWNPTDLYRPSGSLELGSQLEEKVAQSDAAENGHESPICSSEETVTHSVTVPRPCGLKRPASSSENEDRVEQRNFAVSDARTDHQSSLAHQPPSSVELSREIAPTSLSSQPIVPAAKRPRQTIVVSDANYHLKFSYGINAWRHWVQQKIASLGGVSAGLQQYPYLKAELLNMSENDLNTSLSQFVREVRKPNNECYVADSIFYLCLGIQEYLNENGCRINLFGGPVFADFTKALDDILANFQPRISPEGLLICRIEEEHLWEAQQLGSHSPEILIFTVLYLNTKHCGLRLGTAHRQLAFSCFRFTDEDSFNGALLCHLPGHLFEGGAEASTSLRLDANEDCPERCPVELFRTYFSRCPPNLHTADDVFYLVPSYRCGQSDSWFSTTPVEPDELQVMLNRIKMVKEIQEAFMNGQPDGGF